MSKNSTVRKNDYNVAVPPPGIVAGKDSMADDFDHTNNGNVPSINSSALSLRQHMVENLQGPPPPSLNGVILPSTGGGASNHSPEDFMHQRVQRRDHSRSRESSLVPGPHLPPSAAPNIPPPMGVVPHGGSQTLHPIPGTNLPPPIINTSAGGSHENSPPPPQRHQQHPAPGVPPLAVIAAVTQQQGITSPQQNLRQLGMANSTSINNSDTSPSSAIEKLSVANGTSLPNGNNGRSNGLVKFNRNVEKDIFGYYCLSFLNTGCF